MKKDLLVKKILKKAAKKTTILDRILLAILAVGLVLLLFFIGYLVWFGFSNRSVTNLLPAERTVAYMEFQDLSVSPKLGEQAILDLVGLDPLFQTMFGIDLAELSPLAQGRVGLALVNNELSENEFLFFFRARDRKEALEFFQGLGLPDENLESSGDGSEMTYSYPDSQNFAFSFVGPYGFVAKDAEILKVIQAVHRGDLPNLGKDEAYLKSVSNLPRAAWATGYLDIQSLFFGTGHPNNQLVNPLKHITNHFALAVRKRPNGFQFNTLLSLNPQLLELSKGYQDDTRFSYSLTDYISSNQLAAYIGGSNLGAEWQNTLDTISQLNPAYGIILEGIVRAQVSRIFGDDVSLRNDIYPLFEGEYALTFSELEDGRLGTKLLLKHSDQAFAEIKLAKLAKGFQTLAAQFAPKVKSFILPDGTESRELIADTSSLEELTETYEDYDINCLDVEGSVYGFCYSVTEDLMIMSNDLGTVKETIDLGLSPKFVLSQSQAFRKSLGNLSEVNEEITFVNLRYLSPLLMNTRFADYAAQMAESFEAATWVKQYLDDGVMTEGFLLL